jgi:molybdate-binding protein
MRLESVVHRKTSLSAFDLTIIKPERGSDTIVLFDTILAEKKGALNWTVIGYLS